MNLLTIAIEKGRERVQKDGRDYDQMGVAERSRANKNGTWKEAADRIATVIETSGTIVGNSGNQDTPHHA